jgi:hypothetical protein
VDDGIDVQRVRLLLKFVAPLEINVLPGDWADLFGGLRAWRIRGAFLLLEEPREDRGVVKDDAIGD